MSSSCNIILDIDVSGTSTGQTCVNQWRCPSLGEAATRHTTSPFPGAVVRLPNQLTISSTFTVPSAWWTLQAQHLSSTAPQSTISCSTASTPCLVLSRTNSDYPFEIRRVSFEGTAAPFIDIPAPNIPLRLHEVQFIASDVTALRLPMPFPQALVVSSTVDFANITIRPDATSHTCLKYGICVEIPEWFKSPTPTPSSSPSLPSTPTSSPSSSRTPSYSSTSSPTPSSSPSLSSTPTSSPSSSRTPSYSSTSSPTPPSFPSTPSTPSSAASPSPTPPSSLSPTMSSSSSPLSPSLSLSPHLSVGPPFPSVSPNVSPVSSSPTTYTSPSLSASPDYSPHARPTPWAAVAGVMTDAEAVHIPRGMLASRACNQWQCSIPSLPEATFSSGGQIFHTNSGFPLRPHAHSPELCQGSLPAMGNNSYFTRSSSVAAFTVACMSLDARTNHTLQVHIVFLVPPVAMMRRVTIRSMIGKNATRSAVPIVRSRGSSDEFAAVFYGNDNISIAAAPFSPKTALSPLPGAHDTELRISSVMLANASLVRVKPSERNGAVAPGIGEGPQPTLEIGVQETVSGGFQLLFPPANSMETLCHGTQDTSSSFHLASRPHSAEPTLRQLQGLNKTTPASPSIVCSFQLVWTLRIIMEYHTQNSSHPPSSTSVDLYPLAPLHHTQSCPPDCLEMGSGGLVTFVRECPGFFLGPECNDPSTAAEAGCAFGAPPFCRTCPQNAACPGGFRAWPAAGYWTPDEVAGVALRCAAPAEARCTGWSISQRQSTCGAGYHPSAPMCGSCLPGYYLQDGACLSCASAPSQAYGGGNLILPITVVLGAVLVFYLLIVVIFSRAFRVIALPVSKSIGYRLAAEVTLWLVSTLQILIQLARAPSPGIPEWLRDGFSFMQALEVDFSGISPAGCSSNNSPFIMTQLFTASCVAGTGGFFILSCLHLRVQQNKKGEFHDTSDRSSLGLRPIWGVLQFVLSVLAVTLYGPALAKGLEAVNCIEIQHTIWKAPSVGGELQAETERLLAWASDTSVRCYQDEHLMVAVLAWISLLIAGIGLPLSLWCLGSRHLNRFLRARGYGTSVRSPLGTPDQARPERKTRRSCCCCQRSVFCRTLPEEIHAPLRLQRPWSVIYGYGQPWLRPTSIAITFMTSLLSSLLPADSHPIPRGLVLGLLMLAVAAVFVWPSVTLDYHWSGWKRWPRAFAYIASTGLVALQCALALSNHVATPIVTALSWFVALAAVMLPVSVIASLLVWLTHMVSCVAFWRCYGCCCCIPNGGKRNKGLSSILAFTLSLDTENAVRELVRRSGRKSVILAMGSANPSSALRSVHAASAFAMHTPSNPYEKDSRCESEPSADAFHPMETNLEQKEDHDIFLSSSKTNPFYGINSHHLTHGPRRSSRRSTVVHSNPLIGPLQFSAQLTKKPAFDILPPAPQQGHEEDFWDRCPSSGLPKVSPYQHQGGKQRYPSTERGASSVFSNDGQHRFHHSRRSSNAVFKQLLKREVGHGISKSLRAYARNIAKGRVLDSTQRPDRVSTKGN